MNRFKRIGDKLQRINNQNKYVGNPVDVNGQQGKLLMNLIVASLSTTCLRVLDIP